MLGSAWPARAQVFINEVLENPPGAGLHETGWEYVELYGSPGTPLDNMFFLVLKGGADDNRDGTPEVLPEVDEVFDLTGFVLGPDGFFTLVGNRADGESPIADLAFTTNTRFDPGKAESRSNARWSSAATFSAVSSRDQGSRPPRLDNHGSSTYMIVRVDPDDPGRPALSPGTCHDADFDGEFDPIVFVNGAPVVWPMLQVIDEVAWSNRAGREYTISREHQISETHGLNPDAISRVAFYVDNPMRGSRTQDRASADGRVSGFVVRSTSTADESFFYGTLDSERFPKSLVYFAGYDIDGWPQLCGPTDRTRIPYGNLTADPQPDTDPFPAPVARDPRGDIYLDDLFPRGFAATPGRHNDHAPSGIKQFRVIPGDLDFNSVVDDVDVAIARALVGASIDDTVGDPGSPSGLRYKWQGPVLQQICAALSALGTHGDSNRTITAEHVAAVHAMRTRQMP